MEKDGTEAMRKKRDKTTRQGRRNYRKRRLRKDKIEENVREHDSTSIKGEAKNMR